MPTGELANGPQALTPISFPHGKFTTIAFTADNGLQGLPAASIRVAVYNNDGNWHVDTVTVDGAKGQTVVTFNNKAAACGASIRREDAGTVNIGWEVS